MFGNLMGKLQEVQQKAEEAKASLAEARFAGSSVDGSVAVVVDGNGKLIDVDLRDSFLSHSVSVAQNCIKEAVVNAQVQAAASSAEVMKNAAKSFLPGIPGL